MLFISTDKAEKSCKDFCLFFFQKEKEAIRVGFNKRKNPPKNRRIFIYSAKDILYAFMSLSQRADFSMAFHCASVPAKLIFVSFVQYMNADSPR